MPSIEINFAKRLLNVLKVKPVYVIQIISLQSHLSKASEPKVVSLGHVFISCLGYLPFSFVLSFDFYRFTCCQINFKERQHL